MLNCQVQVHFRAHNLKGQLGRIVAVISENEILVYNSELWHLNRPSKSAPWKGRQVELASYFRKPEYVKTLAQRYAGCLGGKEIKIKIWNQLIASGIVPHWVLNYDVNEPLISLRKRLSEFGFTHWGIGGFPDDTREFVALLVHKMGINKAKKYLIDDRHRMVVLRKEGDIYNRTVQILESEFGLLDSQSPF